MSQREHVFALKGRFSTIVGIGIIMWPHEQLRVRARAQVNIGVELFCVFSSYLFDAKPATRAFVWVLKHC